MNERIKELAEQCRIETYGIQGELLYEGFDEEKFALLIVEECADICAKQVVGAVGTYANAHNSAVKKCIDSIQEHFGVGE